MALTFHQEYFCRRSIENFALVFLLAQELLPGQTLNWTLTGTYVPGLGTSHLLAVPRKLMMIPYN